jgi:hypothetical protein
VLKLTRQVTVLRSEFHNFGAVNIKQLSQECLEDCRRTLLETEARVYIDLLHLLNTDNNALFYAVC